jgi:16S rRNA (guanine(527)-N(7))-methyltransferase RsmG
MGKISIVKQVELFLDKFFSDCILVSNVIYSMQLYVDNIQAWNRTHNVCSRSETEYGLWEKIYDSIWLLQVLNVRDNLYFEEEIVDAGAGGGFPGIPLAIILKNQNFNLVESSRKKCSFLRIVRARLKLANVVITNARLESLKPAKLIVSKAAFSPQQVPVLASAASKGGEIVIWATPATCDQFILEFKYCDLNLAVRYDYELPSGKKRCLLLFKN